MKLKQNWQFIDCAVAKKLFYQYGPYYPQPICCEVVSYDIETAIKEAEKLTGLSVNKMEMKIIGGTANWYIGYYPKQPRWLWISYHKLWVWYQLVYRVYLTVLTP